MFNYSRSFERAKRSFRRVFLLIHSYQNEIHPNLFVMDQSSRRDWCRGQAYRACNDCTAGQHTDSVGAAEYSDAMRRDDRARPAITRMTPAEYCLAKLQVPARSHTSWNVGHSNNRDSSLCSYWTLRRSPQSHQQLTIDLCLFSLQTENNINFYLKLIIGASKRLLVVQTV